MKKKIISLVLTIVTVLSCVMVVSAAEGSEHKVEVMTDKATVAFKSDAQENLNVEISNLTSGQYLLLALKAKFEEDSYTVGDIVEENILYINQVGTQDGKAVFENVYPKSITDCVLMIAGPDGKLDIAKIIAGYLFGDVNDDGDIDTTDARRVLQKYLNTLSANATFIEAAANVNGDDEVDTTDARWILEYYLNKRPSLG